jgi:hypothetical protein
MSILDVFKKKDHSEIIHYVVLIEAPLNVVGAQLSTWFINDWRPSGSPLVFKCDDNDPVRLGTKCRAEFKKLVKINWQFEVTRFSQDHFLHCALKGFFKGTETVTIEERGNGIKVDYHMVYELSNPVFQIIWSLLIEEPFVGELRKSMDALKTYCQKAK